VKYLASGFTAAFLSLLSVLPSQAEPNSLPFCHMITSSGRIINLNGLCIQGATNNYYKQLEQNYGFTYSQFASIKTGMKYSQVVEILGSEGTEVDTSEADDGTQTIRYGWKNSDGSGIIAVFEGGSKADRRTLLRKSQYRLR
jgi:hypothetical protein